MRSMKTNSFSPEVRAVDPVTISITNTTVSYQGSVKRMPSLELGAEQIDINQLPGISPMVSQLPPMYGDMFSLTEEPNGTVDIDSLQTPTTRLGPINTQSSTLTPSSESSISQTQRASPILTYITNHDVMANDTDDSLDLGDHDQNIATNDGHGHGHNHKHEDSEEDKLLFKMGFNNGKCSGIDGCISCKRIIKALEWYYVYRDDTELLLKKINEHQYGIYLLHDYQHIMAYHLSIKSYTNNSNGNDVEAQYERIRSLISHECDSNDCKGFKRHKSRHVQSTNDVIIETMDQAHCYFLHLDDEI